MGKYARRMRWVLAAVLMMLQPSAHAVDAHLRIDQLYHTAWRAEDGAPSTILAMAQTTDGFLWIGTPTGLIRFDGNRFEPVTIPYRTSPTPAVNALLDAPDGSLWINFSLNVVARLKDGQFTWFETGRNDGGQPSSLFLDADGSLWNGTVSGLFKLEGGHWRRFGPAEGFSNTLAYEHLLGDDGTLWVHASDGWFVLPRGGTRFARAPAAIAELAALDADGAAWTVGKDGLLHVGAPARAGVAYGGSCTIPGGDPESHMRIDRSGVLWLASRAHGLVRVPVLPAAGATRCDFDQFEEKDGLSSDAVQSMIEDREGNIWVGTTNGLDRFRNGRFVAAPLTVKHEGAAMAALDDGGVLTASFAHGAAIVHADGRVESVDSEEFPRMACAYRGPDGVLWVGGSKSVWRLRGKRLDKVAAPAPIAGRQGPSDAIALLRDATGSLWVEFRPGGLYRLDGATWTAVPTALGGTERHAVMVDGAERGLLLSEGEGVRVIRAGRAQVLGAADGLSAGTVRSIFVRGPNVWIGGNSGLALWRQGQVHTLRTVGGTPFDTVTGIIETVTGELWLNQRSGAVHVSADEVRRTVSDPSHAIVAETFDRLDGLFGGGPSLFPTPSLIEGRDGRLWFSTYSGVFWLDPEARYGDVEPPTARITTLEFKDRTLQPAKGLQLEAGTRQVRFGFTAASLGMPERVRFRYRLSGVDDNWRTSPVRNTTYTNLGPGRYTFSVMAANGSGQWSTAPATFAFSIAPMFWQTAWFKALGVAALAALLWGFYRWRLGVHAHRMQVTTDVRIAERERIAQDLHDTLLQGVLGLTWRLQGLIAELPRGNRVRAAIEGALDTAERLIAEGRDSVQGLRAPREDAELAAAILAYADKLSTAPSPALTCVVEQRPRTLRDDVWQELLRIGCEASSNALRHSGATAISVRVCYGDDILSLTVEDDGVGFVSQAAATAETGRRWGLVGMRERATRLKGKLLIDSTPGGGTTVRLEIAAGTAYAERKPGRRWRRAAGT